MTGVSDSSLPPVDQALLPAAVRNGTKQQKEQYDAALQFERTLVNQMTESMMKTASVGGEDDTDSAATKIMKESIPGHLADAIMGAGGLGLAQQLYTSFGNDDATKKTSLSDQAAATAAPSAATNPAITAAGPGGLTA